MSEGDIQRRIMIAVSRWGARCWRNNTGMGWAGKPVMVIKRPQRVAVAPGDVVIRNARPLHAGLCVGSSDLIGVAPVKIRPEHVDTTVGVFTAIEVKTEDGTASDEQENFVDQINGLGGLAGIARCDDDALRILSKLK